MCFDLVLAILSFLPVKSIYTDFIRNILLWLTFPPLILAGFVGSRFFDRDTLSKQVSLLLV